MQPSELPYLSVPAETPTPLIVEIPHAGLELDAPTLATLVAPAHSIARDADLYVNDLFAEAPAYGAHLLSARFSRYACDLNRCEDDIDCHAVVNAPSRMATYGVIWSQTTRRVPALRQPLLRAEYDRRMRHIYRPYHEELSHLVATAHSKFGFAILLCGHSMPSVREVQKVTEHAKPVRNADVVPGTRNHTTASIAVIEQVEAAARDYDMALVHDEPYAGGFTTAHYGRPPLGVHAVQIELARGLYMDEETLTKNARSFSSTKEFCNNLVSRLSTLQAP